jgi:hypothetical protein
VCVREERERERATTTTAKCTGLIHSVRVVYVCVLLSVVDGKRSEGPTRVYVSRPLDALFEGPPNVDFGCPVICTALLL